MSNINGTNRKSPTPGDTRDGNQAKEVAPRTTSSDNTTSRSSSSAAAAAVTASSMMMEEDNQDHHSNERNRKRSKRIMHISSDEINVLVYRYLQEAGMFKLTLLHKICVMNSLFVSWSMYLLQVSSAACLSLSPFAVLVISSILLLLLPLSLSLQGLYTLPLHLHTKACWDGLIPARPMYHPELSLAFCKKDFNMWELKKHYDRMVPIESSTTTATITIIIVPPPRW